MNLIKELVSRQRKSSDRQASLEYFIMAFVLKEYATHNLLMSQYKIHQDKFPTFDEFKSWLLEKYSNVLTKELKEELK